MEDDIGVLPLPKYDENTQKYYGNVEAGGNLVVIPGTVTDYDRTSIIVEALCAEGYRRVIPEFFERVLKTKLARDDESAGMMDIIKEGRLFDYGYYNTEIAAELAYPGCMLFHYMKNENFTSYYEKYAGKVEKNIEKLRDK